MADRFQRAFGSFLRRIVDMGDGTYSERVVASPPADMVVDGKLQVDAEMDFPPDMVIGDRLKVNLDEPIDVTLPAALIAANRLQVDIQQPAAVTLPAALINANRLKVEVDDPIDVLLPANLITGTTKPRLRVDVGQTSFFEKREFEMFREFATATTGTYVLRVVSPVNFILQDLELEMEAGAARLATFSGGTPTGVFSETLSYVAANTMTESPPAYTPQVVITAIPTGGSLTGGTSIRISRAKAADNSNFASSVGSTPDLIAGRAPGTYYLTLQLTAAICVLKARFEERP